MSLMRFLVQYQDDINVGCDPDGYPTNDYIQRYASSEPRVHHMRLTFSLGIPPHIPIQTSHLGWVPQRVAVSISHGRRIASSTNAEHHSRRTLFICATSRLSSIFVSVPVLRQEAAPSARSSQTAGTAGITLILFIYSISSLTSQCARQPYHSLPNRTIRPFLERRVLSHRKPSQTSYECHIRATYISSPSYLSAIDIAYLVLLRVC